MIWFVNQMICLGSKICLREAFHDPPEEDLDALLKCYHIAISILQSSLVIFVLFPFRLSPLELNSLNMGAVLLTPTSAAPEGTWHRVDLGLVSPHNNLWRNIGGKLTKEFSTIQAMTLAAWRGTIKTNPEAKS